MKHNKLVTIFLISALLSACGNLDKASDSSNTEIVNFHRQFNELKFREIYKSASPDLKLVTTEADFIKGLELEHNKLGKQVSSLEVVSNTNFSSKTVVSIKQNTTFEHGKGVEIFRYIVSDNNCILQGYNITSNDLLIK
jgi:NADPH-dependent curcumin reductase CurA